MGVSLIIVWLSTALAGRVEVEDATGCIDSEGLRSELTEVIGRDAMMRIDVFADVGAEADRRDVALTVDAGSHRWTKVLDVAAVDCPYVASAAALTIQRGLSALPGFDWEKLVRGPPLVRLGGAVGLTGPVAPRVLVAARASLGDRFRGIANLRFEGSPLWRNIGARVVAVSIGLSVGPSWRSGFLEIRPELGGQLGPLWVLSNDPDVPPSDALFHLTGVGGVELGGAGPWSTGFHGEFARPISLMTTSGDKVGEEPGIRAMLTFLYTPKIGEE